MSSSAAPDLLLLRLDAFERDIEKVRAAVDSAEQRCELLRNAHDEIKPVNSRLRAAASRLARLQQALETEPRIADSLNDADFRLSEELRDTPQLLAEAISAVTASTAQLDQVIRNTVRLDDRLEHLRPSLYRRCEEMTGKLDALRSAVSANPGGDRRQQWLEYQCLLDGMARPLFAEYVDFLGGLSVRDMGLDDQVCEMTARVLTRFMSVTKRSLPLPARQAALGNALDSVVLLGFPEWSVWGIPLVGHEVGLAYANGATEIGEIVRRYATGAPGEPGSPPTDAAAPAQRSAHHVTQLIADSFATFTLGLAYACAALLLRLNPRHDEPVHADRPRDIDRARVIMMTLKSDTTNGGAAGGSFTDAVEMLGGIWEDAVRAHAKPGHGDAAVAAAAGPPASEDWLDDLTRDAVRQFENMRGIMKPYDSERWQASDPWVAALRDRQAGPSWQPEDDAVVDVLTAAWRLRLDTSTNPTELANDIKERWTTARRGG